MSNKIERPEKDFKYVFLIIGKMDNILVIRDYNKADIDIATLDNIYDFKKFGSYSATILIQIVASTMQANMDKIKFRTEM